MHTLIELYDERPLENVLGVEAFHPEKVVFVLPDSIPGEQRVQSQLRNYFRHRGLEPEISFIRANIYDTEAMLRTLRCTAEQETDCAMDITGGTDAVLFASGLLSAERPIPVFTYSRRRNKFYDIRNAPFASKLPCEVRFSVEDFFRMAGGSMRTGRVDNAILSRYLPDFEPFFRLYLRYRRDWTQIVTYLQRASQTAPDVTPELRVDAPYVVKGERASRISAPEDTLRDLAELGFLQDLRIVTGERVSFAFRDQQIRTWLRDVGSVLELYVYKASLDTELFDDVRTSAVVDWEGDRRDNAVTNELDVMCSCGVIPVFISCKTCDVKTEALNELAILRDRFGGQMARAAIVTAERVRAVTRNRAAELNIRVLDLSDLQAGRIQKRIRELMRDTNF